jgi:hypothetical protein
VIHGRVLAKTEKEAISACARGKAKEVHGHVSFDKTYYIKVSKGAVERPAETEVRDAVILGDMMKYFGIDV